MLKVGLAIIFLAFVLVSCAFGQARTQIQSISYCDVVASPADYNGKVLSVEVILSPSEHLLALYGAACVPREGYNVTTQAILPAFVGVIAQWEEAEGISKTRSERQSETRRHL